MDRAQFFYWLKWPKTCRAWSVHSVGTPGLWIGFTVFVLMMLGLDLGFFNKKNPLGHVLPGFFQQSVWSPALGVTAKHSTEAQVRAAVEWLETVPNEQRALLFINVSATQRL